ncbi:hypothetical protein D3C71_1786470 [compost metagenome]
MRQRRPAADLAHDGLARQRAGHLATGVPAHAISDQPQRQFAIPVIRILIEVTAQAGVGQVSEFDHEGACR